MDDPNKWEDKTSNQQFCEKCGRPFYQAVPRPPEKRFMNIKTNNWIIIIIVIFVVGLLVAGGFLFSVFLSSGWEDYSETTEFSDTVYIADGGHFKYACGYLGNNDEINVSVSLINGSSFDLYIMNIDQIVLIHKMKKTQFDITKM